MISVTRTYLTSLTFIFTTSISWLENMVVGSFLDPSDGTDTTPGRAVSILGRPHRYTSPNLTNNAGNRWRRRTPRDVDGAEVAQDVMISVMALARNLSYRLLVGETGRKLHG